MLTDTSITGSTAISFAILFLVSAISEIFQMANVRAEECSAVDQLIQHRERLQILLTRETSFYAQDNAAYTVLHVFRRAPTWTVCYDRFSYCKQATNINLNLQIWK